MLAGGRPHAVGGDGKAGGHCPGVLHIEHYVVAVLDDPMARGALHQHGALGLGLLDQGVVQLRPGDHRGELTALAG